MDRIEQYRTVVTRILEEFRDRVSSGDPIRYQLVKDVQNGHFLLICCGWEGHRYTYQTIYHIDIIDGKIWVQFDATDRPIVQELLAAGIPKTDIVLGEYPVEVRKHNGFAIG